MIIQNQHLENLPISGLYELYHKIDDNTFFVNSPCVFCVGKLLKRHEVYEIHDFKGEGVSLRYIKLLWVYLKGFDFFIIGADIQTGELLRRRQRLDADELPCSFLIAEVFYFTEDRIYDKVIKTFCNGE